jgi:hypothetical protein
MRAGFVDSSHKQANTVGPTTIMLSVYLGLVGNSVDYTSDWDGAVVEESGRHGLLTHKVGENSSIGSKASESYS